MEWTKSLRNRRKILLLVLREFLSELIKYYSLQKASAIYDFLMISGKIELDYFAQFCLICDALRNLVPFVQFKKREKHLWGVLLLKAYTSSWVFFAFLKLCK